MASGTSTDESLTSFALTSPSSKTSPAERRGGCPRCGGNCASLDTTRPLWLFPPRTSAPLIDGLGSSSSEWPTPTVCGNDNRKGLSPTSGDGLATAVKDWPTPTASPYGSNHGGEQGRVGEKRRSLGSLVKDWPPPMAADSGRASDTFARGNPTLMGAIKQQGSWATPTAAYRGDCPSERARNTPGLVSQVASWATPRASDGPKGGPNQRGTKGDESLSMQASGTLNPEFVEILMGFPQGWTDISGQPDEAPTSTSGSRPARSRRKRSKTESPG